MIAAAIFSRIVSPSEHADRRQAKAITGLGMPEDRLING
jgi:hypothetical protein